MTLTLAGPATWQEEIKRSRFLATAAPVADPDEALAWIAAHRDPRATHNAWAFRAGGVSRCHDDGEVSGTAGRPMLGTIEKQGLERVAVLVTRFYGGVKLGSGGLVRAYGGVAGACLQAAPRRELVARRRVRLTVPFAGQGRVFGVLHRLPVERCGETATVTGITLDLRFPPDLEVSLRLALQDALRGHGLSWEFQADELL